MTKLPVNEFDTVRWSRSVPMSGILAILVGFGLLLSLQRFVSMAYVLSLSGQLFFIIAGVVLVLWGLSQVRNGVWPQPGSPRLYRLNRHRFRIPREGLGYLAITIVMFVASFTGRSNTLLLVFSMMIGPWVLNGWIAFIMCQRTHVTRRNRQRAMAGEPFAVEIECDNRKFLFASWMLTVRDRIRSRSESLETAVLFVRIPRRERRRVSYQLCLARRGQYTLGPIEIMTRFPLGLVQRGLLINEPGEILVHPRVGQLPANWQYQLEGFETIEQSATRPGPFDDQFHQLREYRFGDNASAIHWRTSAKRNELMVCEYHQSRDPSFSIMLDLWSPEHPSDAQQERVELAVSFAATLGIEQLQATRDANMFVAASGKGYDRWEEQPGQSLAESLLDMLALIQAGPSNFLEQMLNEARQLGPRGARLLLLTTRKKSDPAYGDFQQTLSEIGAFDNRSSLSIVEADPLRMGGSLALV